MKDIIRITRIITGIILMSAPLRAVAQNSAADPQIAAAVKQVSTAQIKGDIERLVSFGTRSTLSASDPAAKAKGRGIAAAREWIQSEFERYAQACGGCLEVRTDGYIQEPGPRIPSPTELVNVYAVLRGSDAENAKRMYVVVGHYDSRNSENNDAQGDAPGANDDGSGTTVVLESARVLSKYRFPATVVFLAVAGEEQGLYGSKHFAKMAHDQGWNIEGVLSNDIVGGDKNKRQDTSTVRVFSEGIPATATETELRQIRAIGAESDSASRQLARYVREIAKQYTRPFTPTLVFRPDRYLRGGDHSSFNQQGFAAIRFAEFREEYNHQHQNPRRENGIEYGDLPKFVDFDYLAKVTQLNAAALASLASAPAPPRNVRLETKQLVNDSTLAWEASPGGLASGYEIVWRPTDAPEWTQVKPVGNVTRATIDVSKDNVIFGVRAVDAKGHRSLAVLPAPER